MNKMEGLKRGSEESKNLKYSDIKVDIELKRWFLDEAALISEETKTSYENLLYKIDDYERKFGNGKSVYQFSKEDLLDMFSMFGSSSVNTLNVYLSIIRKYIDFAQEKGRIKTNINQANNITFDELSELINKTKQSRFVMRQDLYYLTEENVVNKQDQAMILLAFEGIKGTENSELTNLKREDIDSKNLTVTIYREVKEKDTDGNTKIITVPLNIKVPRRLMNILELTNSETEYQFNNGNYGLDENLNIRRAKRPGEAELLTLQETPYFLRPIRVKDVHGGKITGVVVQKRCLVALKEYLKLPFATVNSIYMSGILDRLCRYTEELEKDVLTYSEVAEFLNKTYESVNAYQTYQSYTDYLDEWRNNK